MGWKRGESFIPFEALSTGERVLFSAALMTALILFREPQHRMENRYEVVRKSQ